MSSKEITKLRKEGKLSEALDLALHELNSAPDDIWALRNISWVYYEYIKQYNSSGEFEAFIGYLNKIADLNLPANEHMLFDSLAFQIGKMIFSILKVEPLIKDRIDALFLISKTFHFTKPSESYSFLFKAFHKGLKASERYIEFADWWDFNNFMPADYENEKMPNGKEIMAIAEQAYITYARHLLPKYDHSGELIFNSERAKSFLPVLSTLMKEYPNYQYPAYYHAKLLLALGDRDEMLKSLLPFAKRKRNDFWVWELLAEAFSTDQDKVFACYCKALSCKSPEEMLISLRQKMARLLISKILYNEARTEIDLLVSAREVQGYKVPAEVTQWKSSEWYRSADQVKSNLEFYNRFIPIAEEILFSDIPEEFIIVEFVNTDKKMLNFIASESNFGFFKYDRFIKEVKAGDVLRVRFQGGSNEGMHQIYTAVKVDEDSFKKRFTKDVSGTVRISSGKSFGFMEDVFIHPSLVTKYKLKDQAHFSGMAIKSYNSEKKKWGWKLL